MTAVQIQTIDISLFFDQDCPEAFPLFLLSCTAQQVNGVLPVGSQCCGLPPVIKYVLFIRNPVLWLVNTEYLSLNHEAINVTCWQTLIENPTLLICAPVYVLLRYNII